MENKENKFLTIKQFAKETGLSPTDIKFLCINHMIPHLEFKTVKDDSTQTRYKIHLKRGMEAILKLENEINMNPKTVPTVKSNKKLTTKDCLNELKKTIRV